MKTGARGFGSKKNGLGTLFEGIYIVEGRRTPFGKYCGTLSTLSPTDLGILSSRAVLEAAGVPGSEVDQTIVANIGQSSADAFFLPRHIGIYSGAPLESPALLAQRICGSGIEIIGLAAEQIALGKSRLVLCCGTDTMSKFPLVSFDGRQGFQLGKPGFVDLLWEALNDTAAVPMGHTADNLAREYKLGRREVDEFAISSQEKYSNAQKKGVFSNEVIKVSKEGILERSGLKPRKYRLKGSDGIESDEHPRMTTLEKLGSLPFVFTKEGPTTAGSASGIVDGACAVLAASGEYIKAHGLKAIGRILGCVSVGVEPSIMGIGPAPAIRSLLSELGLGLKDIDLFEINEAFGAQCLAVARELELDLSKLNVNGGAIAIGHPLAASGCRLATTCLKELKRRNGRLGIVSACIGGGQGIAMAVEVA
ncbi:MAG: thiolase family protein [Bdellovibrionota bacterium]